MSTRKKKLNIYIEAEDWERLARHLPKSFGLPRHGSVSQLFQTLLRNWLAEKEADNAR